MTRECDGLMGCFFGHKMRPRYSETRAFPAWLSRAKSVQLSEPLEFQDVARTYEGDVCERCGYTTRTEGKP
jgi:hypothetical protein